MRGFLVAALAACVGLFCVLGLVAATSAVVYHMTSADVSTCPHGCCEGQCSPGCPGCVSPFDTSNPGYCVPGQPCPTCPGGQCPYVPNRPNGSIEVGEPREGAVDQRALTEPKAGDCATCPTCPRYPTAVPVIIRPAAPAPVPVVVRPVVAPAPVPVVTPRPVPDPVPNAMPAKVAGVDDVREGVFKCAACRGRTVGAEWKELWADDGTTLTCLCQKCWDRMQPSQREAHLRAYVKAAGLSPAQAFYANAVIAELASR